MGNEPLTTGEQRVVDAMLTARTESEAAEKKARTGVSERVVTPDNLRMDAIDEARFWSKVDRSGGPEACWPWMAGRNVSGYGRFYLNGKARLASRRAFVLDRGREPRDGYMACHTCDNPPCCNPAHLYEGTAADNRADAVRKMRAESPWMW